MTIPERVLIKVGVNLLVKIETLRRARYVGMRHADHDDVT